MTAMLKNGARLGVREITPGDGEMLGAMLEDCSEQTRHSFHPYPLTRASGLRVAGDETILCLLAVADGEAVGYVWIDRDGELPVLGICVRDGWQGHGIGGMLMQEIIAEAKTLVKAGIRLSVMQDNLPGQKLYRKMGFEIDGEDADPEGPSYLMTLHFHGQPEQDRE